jgi:diguanylate cyclase (GGDEF)-like protein
MKPEERLFDYLKELIYEDDAGDLDVNNLPEELQDLGQGLLQLSVWLKEVKVFASELSDGNLDAEPPGRDNPLAGSLKALQATMTHIAWQAKQVTKGDFSQRIDFMGDLSAAFNEMTEQLRIKTEELERSRDKAIESRDQYKEVALVDDMTGLHNRHYIMPLLERMIEKKMHFCLSFIDLDHLKQANDLYGHSEGDRYIREAARIIDAIPGEKETARVGGDEFLIIMPEISEAEFTSLLEEARNKLMGHHNETARYTRSFSFGIVEVDSRDGRSRNEILNESDHRMYAYKQAYKCSLR